MTPQKHIGGTNDILIIHIAFIVINIDVDRVVHLSWYMGMTQIHISEWILFSNVQS